MSESPPAPPSFTRSLLIIGACLAAYGLFWLLGRPLLPPRALVDRTAGLLPTLVVAVASVSLLRHQRRGPWLAFGIAAGVLLVYAVLLRILLAVLSTPAGG